ncbi:hypothetical protein D3C77_403270 [compost metagenome]
MKLIAQDDFPAIVQRLAAILLPILAQYTVHDAQPLRITIQQLQLPIHSFVVCLACICSAMVFQIQLAIPCMHIAVGLLHRLIQFPEKFIRSACFQLRHAWNPIQSTAHFQHFAVHAAAAVAIAIRQKQLLIHLFVAIGVPASFNGLRDDLTIVSIEPRSRL